MPSTFSWSQLKAPIICLAPMAGYTDSAFRQLIKSINPGVICFTEFISADGLKFGNEKTQRYLTFDPSEQPLIVQIFGKKADTIKRACEVAEASGAAGVDINMGCPAPKVTKSFHGAWLTRTPELAFELVKTARQSTKLPVSVKTRLGWENNENLFNFALGLEQAGAQALTIHGRTAKQAYSGIADWTLIYEVKKKLSIPVIGNGDVKNLAEGLAKMQNLDGFMIGRASMGNPWIFDPNYDPNLSFAAKMPVILRHCELNVKAKGEKWGMLEMRKHLLSYVRGFDGAKELRIELCRVATLDEAKEILAEAEKLSRE